MINANIVRLKDEVSQLPLLPGVYQFVNAEGIIIYVGKAKSLRKRVSSYFMENKEHTTKVRVLVKQIDQIRHIVVSSESDALLLENNLIKTLQPRYNILLKDDKTYPWIVIRNEPFPRIESTRRMVKDGSRYFGPYASISMQRSMLELIKSVYQLRTCSLNLSPQAIGRGKYNVCLEYHIGNCKAPCVGYQTDLEYSESISMIAQMLKGETRDSQRYMEQQMNVASAKMQFELAHRYKQRLQALESYVSRSVIVSNNLSNLDVFSLIADDGVGYCNFVRIVLGAVVNTFTAEFALGVDDDPKTILSYAIMQISERISGHLAREVVVEFMPEQSLFPDVNFIVPQRGDKLKLLEFSQRGAKIYRLERLKNMEIVDPQRHTNRLLESLRKELRMKVLPQHIECFDNSNLQGTNAVASCVVFRDCKPSRKEYRHFNIKTVVGPDDFASMREILNRRYTRLLAENSELPQLIVVDGGKGQLSAAYGVLKELGIADKVTIIGLAKRIEEVFYPNDSMPYYLDRTGEPLKVIMHLRDEAHRFGITFHRQKRSLAFIKSELESVEGIGASSIVKLMRRFKTISALGRASVEDLAQEVGQKRAEAVNRYFSDATKCPEQSNKE